MIVAGGLGAVPTLGISAEVRVVGLEIPGDKGGEAAAFVLQFSQQIEML